MGNGVPSFKQVQIDKANVRMLVAISAAVFVVVFCAVATKSLVSRQMYQARVIESREKARDQLEINIDSAEELSRSYGNFIELVPNVIGGDPSGTGEKDGDNAKIVLDALPSAYDFPALTSSIEKIAQRNQLSIESITGTDDEVNQKGQTSSTPAPVEMPFSVTVKGSYQGINGLIVEFEKSIRPFRAGKFVFTGTQDGQVSLLIDGKSYYQPAKNLEVKKEVVK